MGYLQDVLDAWKYRRRKEISPQEFIETFKSEFGRDIDPESEFFFRHHPITVNLLHSILSANLRQSGDESRDGQVVQALIAEMAESTPTAGSLLPDSPNLMADVVEEFTKTYQDAGRLTGHALALFLMLE